MRGIHHDYKVFYRYNWYMFVFSYTYSETVGRHNSIDLNSWIR